MYSPRAFFRLLPAVLALLLPAAALAVQFPGLYTVTVPGSDTAQVDRDALGAVLVRLTGAAGVAGDSAFAGMLGDAGRYVQLQRATTGGQWQVSFDAAAVTAALAAAGRTAWNLDRPEVLVLLQDAPDDATAALRQQLQAEAAVRGLPVRVAAAPAGLAAGRAALLQAARQAGAEAALLGVAPHGVAADSQWTLAAPQADGHWTGTAAAGIDAAVDALVRGEHQLDSAVATDVNCEVSGVDDLAAFTAVMQVLGAVPGVDAVQVRSAGSGQLQLVLHARAGAAALAGAIVSPQLVAAGTAAPGALAYRYQRAP